MARFQEDQPPLTVGANTATCDAGGAHVARGHQVRKSHRCKIEALRGVPLASRRRELLSRAGSGDWVAVTFPDQSAAASEALSRAARALVALGLAEVRTASSVIFRAESAGRRREAARVALYCGQQGISGGRVLIRLTALGLAIVRFFKRALEAGRAIRWSRFIRAVESGRISVN